MSRVGNLSNKYGRWMSSHAHELHDRLPKPCCRWSWSDVELEQSELLRLRDAGLIEQVGPQTWRTRTEAIDAVADYGRFERKDVGVMVGQVVINIENQ